MRIAGRKAHSGQAGGRGGTGSMSLQRLLRDAPVAATTAQVPARELAPPPLPVGDGPEAVMAAAHAEAPGILAEGEAQRAAGFAEGHAEGMVAAREEALAEVRTALTAV